MKFVPLKSEYNLFGLFLTKFLKGTMTNEPPKV
jgi:hypothetical protein